MEFNTDCLKKMQASNHCLHKILPNECRSLHGMEMHKRGYDYNLPIFETEIARNSF